MFVHITRKSANKKTGPIPVTTTEQSSCPATCSMREACYAKSGPLALHWRKVSAGERGTDWEGLCDFVRSLPDGQLWRHNQAGDIPHSLGFIDSKLLFDLVDANKGKCGYTYTHHNINEGTNKTQLIEANKQGFTINISTESLSDADDAIAKGLPAVCVVPNDQPTPKHTPAGTKCVVCPAQQRSISCADCKLCSKSDRRCVVLFKAHGNKARKANQIVSAK